MHPKKSATSVILSCLLPSKGKVLLAHHHSTTGLGMLKNAKFARESNTPERDYWQKNA